jgi:hypothetical protein
VRKKKTIDSRMAMGTVKGKSDGKTRTEQTSYDALKKVEKPGDIPSEKH